MASTEHPVMPKERNCARQIIGLPFSPLRRTFSRLSQDQYECTLVFFPHKREAVLNPNDYAGSVTRALKNATTIPEMKSPTEYAFEALVDEVRQFEGALSEGEVVGAMLASFGQSITLQISSISRSGQFFCFDGLTGDGDQARLVQHFTQTSVLLVKLKTELPRRPIGFVAN